MQADGGEAQQSSRHNPAQAKKEAAYRQRLEERKEKMTLLSVV